MTRFLARTVLLLLLGLVLAGCSSNSGLPRQPGSYDVRSGSVSFDGERYAFLWADSGGQLHQAEGRDIRLAQADANKLQIGEGSPVLQIKDDERVAVRGQDR